MPDDMKTTPLRDLVVLVLDDEPIILMDLEFTLSDAGMTALTASSAARALKAIEGQVPDVAVLDVNLGHDKTCEPVADKLRELNVPFILHTGDLDRHGEVVTKFEAPIVAKPSTGEAIIQALEGLIRVNT